MAESFLPSGLSNIAIPGVAPLLPVNVDDTRISDSSDTSLPPIVPLSSPSALALPSQLLSPMRSYPSPYQTLPQVHAILSLSQSSPSPLSRTNSPFEFTGLSPKLGMVNRSTLLSAGSRVSREQSSASPVDSTRLMSHFLLPHSLPPVFLLRTVTKMISVQVIFRPPFQALL